MNISNEYEHENEHKHDHEHEHDHKHEHVHGHKHEQEQEHDIAVSSHNILNKRIEKVEYLMSVYHLELLLFHLQESRIKIRQGIKLHFVFILSMCT